MFLLSGLSIENLDRYLGYLVGCSSLSRDLVTVDTVLLESLSGTSSSLSYVYL